MSIQRIIYDALYCWLTGRNSYRQRSPYRRYGVSLSGRATWPRLAPNGGPAKGWPAARRPLAHAMCQAASARSASGAMPLERTVPSPGSMAMKTLPVQRLVALSFQRS